MHFSENPNLYRKSHRLFKVYWNLHRDKPPALPKKFSRKAAKTQRRTQRKNVKIFFFFLCVFARASFSSMKVVRRGGGNRKGEWLHMLCFNRNNVILVLQHPL